jgi:hypothetical protein
VHEACERCNGEGIITTKQPVCKTCENTGRICGAPDCGDGCRCPDCYCEDCTFAPCQCGDIHTVCAECDGSGAERQPLPNLPLWIVLLIPNFLLWGAL